MESKGLEKLMPEQEFAKEVLGVSSQTIWRMKQRGELPPHITLAGKRYYRPSDIEAWFRAKIVA